MNTTTTPDETPNVEVPIPSLDVDTAQRVVTELEHSWHGSFRGPVPHRQVFRLAGLAVALESSNAELFGRTWPALSHHLPAEPHEDVDLTIRMWDVSTSDAPRPRLPAGIIGPREARVIGAVNGRATPRLRFEEPGRAVMAWDPASPTAWWCTDTPSELPWWEEAAPFRSLLSWWLPTVDRHLAHGAAVGSTEGAILLVGPGGSGKSTTALASHLAGVGYLGDDYCVITTDGAAHVHSLYGTAKLRLADHDERGPLAGHLLRPTPPPGGKAVALVSARPGAVVVDSAPVVAVAAVRVGTGPDTQVHDASVAEVLTALAPSSLLQLPGAPATSFAAMARLVSGARRYRVELGHDRERVVDTVRSLLSGHPAVGAAP